MVYIYQTLLKPFRILAESFMIIPTRQTLYLVTSVNQRIPPTSVRQSNKLLALTFRSVQEGVITIVQQIPACSVCVVLLVYHCQLI